MSAKNSITVIGKGNLGFSPKFGEILEGQEYEIEAADFADQLFTHKRTQIQTKAEVKK